MLIHADSYHPNKSIRHFIGRNVIFSYAIIHFKGGWVINDHVDHMS